MIDSHLWSVVSVALSLAVTFIGALTVMLAYGHHRRHAVEFSTRAERLPDATRYANLVVRIEELRDEYDTLRDNVFDAQQTIEAAQNQRQWMEDAKEEIARLEQDRMESARIQSELETLQTQLANLHEQKSALDGEINDCKDRIEGLNDEQRSITRNLDELREEVARAETIREQIKELEARKKQAQDEAEQLEQAAGKLRRKLEDELEQQKRTARKEADSLDSELESLRRRRNESEEAADKLQNALNQLAAEKTDLEKERRKLKKEVEELESKSSSLAGQIPTMQSVFDNLASAVAQHDGPTKPEENEIWQPVLSVADVAHGNARREIECLSDLEQTLVSHGLKFDQRTLYAFHTSLKATDSSPLITLAGVSGTGKSELPRRYAEATGMNFLNVAVQPRWDSPQDLFGFYDYLERRFRPTDLTRALIQMDPIGDEKGRGWDSPKEYKNQRMPNQLLLVLLDEMNLARIEYYFSEFLSRLETRRGIDVQDPTKRKLAEISLDVGGRRSGQPPMQLFVDKNVLFVGTMNEDETTQALSDKVIDRANVLRFGSPNSIDPVPASKRNGRTAQTRPRLSRKTWDSWCKSADNLDDSARGKLLEWIGELRTAMDRVNRPFAYRVAHSMLEYAANYPEIEGRLELVIADQIEQKILPKLMGLNPQEPSVQKAFSTIDHILDEVDDDALKEKIDDCRKDDYFQWSGIDRSEI